MFNLFLALFLFIILPTKCFSQIASSSFFPNVKTINPGISHLRNSGLLTFDTNKTIINKNQDINVAGILEGINTQVDLTKTTIYRAGKGPGFTLELLYDQEQGTRTESFSTSTYSRKTTTKGRSSVFGGVIDLGLIGFNLSKATYQNSLDFNIGSPPDLNRVTHDTKLEYRLMRVGTSVNLYRIAIGIFHSTQQAQGSVSSILFNPSTGQPNTPEISNLKFETTSFGTGISYSSRFIRLEASFEKILSQSLTQSNTYLIEINTPTEGERVSIIGEAKIGNFSFGLRVRQIKGNYSDLEQLISSNMLYLNANEKDSRIENSFNLSYGKSHGYSISGFFTTSTVNTEEANQFDDDKTIKYNTTIINNSYGLSLNYIY